MNAMKVVDLMLSCQSRFDLCQRIYGASFSVIITNGPKLKNGKAVRRSRGDRRRCVLKVKYYKYKTGFV